ncbi:hypothetical protein STCU_11521 [Strigomonas culicis]|uniref:Uncharacterized protein n=1 Tax=Strigomonas culicis TaxID=28005 RepID=S9TII0_9TRYP|nr:hypothetical protein STCU_11521 [Strigomonas culicis]|eukprot:EPY16148.1 hypothetical protein STCU_11521 [Strigomonas culicis]
MLTTDELQALTLKSKLVYDHGNKSFFVDGINKLSEHIEKYIPVVLQNAMKSQKPSAPPHTAGADAPILGEANVNPATNANPTTISTENLNFFVRYKCRDGDREFHRWSRIEEVLLVSSETAETAAIADPSQGSVSGLLTINTQFSTASQTQTQTQATTTTSSNGLVIWKNSSSGFRCGCGLSRDRWRCPASRPRRPRRTKWRRTAASRNRRTHSVDSMRMQPRGCGRTSPPATRSTC